MYLSVSKQEERSKVKKKRKQRITHEIYDTDCMKVKRIKSKENKERRGEERK